MTIVNPRRYRIAHAPEVAARFGADDHDRLIANGFGQGVWTWDGTAWRILTRAYMLQMTRFDADVRVAGEPRQEDELAVSFSDLGLWQFNYSHGGARIESWTQLTSANPVSMVSADYHGAGRRTCLIVDFGPGIGLWLYDSGAGLTEPTWRLLSEVVPE